MDGADDDAIDDHGAAAGDAVFDDVAAIAQADVRAAVDIAAGRLISNAAVLHWLTCWGGDVPLLPLSWE